MTRLHELFGRASTALRRNERLAARLLAAAVVIACIGLLTPPIRDRFLVRAQVSVARWDDRWTERLERGEALVAEGRFEEAVVHLDALDRVHPARHVKHRRDIERERLLHALGRANLELGRKQASLDAFRRAVAFDPRNYRNHFALAEAALVLGEPDEAVQELGLTLEIHPSHLPAVATLIAFRHEGADYRAVVDAYETYLDAPLVHPATVRLGAGVGRADALADGLPQELEVTLHTGGSDPARGRELSIGAGAHPGALGAVTLFPSRRAGILDPDPIRLQPAVAWGVGDTDGEAAGGDGAEADEEEGPNIIRVAIGSETGPVARARVGLTLRKQVDPETWKLVAASYRNLLQGDALEIARERSEIVVPEPAGPSRSGSVALVTDAGSARGEAAVAVTIGDEGP